MVILELFRISTSFATVPPPSRQKSIWTALIVPRGFFNWPSENVIKNIRCSLKTSYLSRIQSIHPPKKKLLSALRCYLHLISFLTLSKNVGSHLWKWLATSSRDIKNNMVPRQDEFNSILLHILESIKFVHYILSHIKDMAFSWCGRRTAGNGFPSALSTSNNKHRKNCECCPVSLLIVR